MAYSDVNTPVIEQIVLPSGNQYYIADREIRDVVSDLEELIAGGVSFIIAWNGASTPQVAQIPAGVVVTYQGQTYTGTLSPETSGTGVHAKAGAFYLVASSTSTTGAPLDVYDEYVPVGADGSKTWEKIGDTQVDLSDVVTNVTLNKQTANVIGASSTFSTTNPSVTLSTGSTGDINILTGDTEMYFQATASGTAVTASKTNIKATASGANTAWNSKDQKAAITALGTPSTESAVKSVTPTTKKLATTTVTGVSGSTTPNVVKSRTSQTTADGTGTTSTTNTDWLKGVSVTNGVLTIGAATLDTQTTYSADAPSSITIPTAASAATTVATGATTTTGSGADVVTDVSVGDTFNAVTGYASPTTANVIGASSTFTITQPTIALATGATAGTGVISVATDASVTTQPIVQLSSSPDQTSWTDVNAVKYVSGVTQTKASATASGTSVSWNSKDQKTVLTNSTDVNVTKGGNS